MEQQAEPALASPSSTVPPPPPGPFSRAKAWVLKGDGREIVHPPEWVFRRLVAWAFLLVAVGLVITPAWPLVIALDVLVGLQVYEDRRARGLSRFWWSTGVASYGPPVFVFYAHSRRRQLQAAAEAAAREESEPPPLPPAGWYPDPLGDARLRYWSGAAWTQDLRR